MDLLGRMFAMFVREGNKNTSPSYRTAFPSKYLVLAQRQRTTNDLTQVDALSSVPLAFSSMKKAEGFTLLMRALRATHVRTFKAVPVAKNVMPRCVRVSW